jgi:hypothetical protein
MNDEDRVVATFPIDMLDRKYMQVDTECISMYKKPSMFSFSRSGKMITMDYREVFNKLFESIDKNNFINPSEAKWKCKNGDSMLPIIGFLQNRNGTAYVPSYSFEGGMITFYNEYKTRYSNFLQDVNLVRKRLAPNNAREPPQFAFSGGTRRSRKRRSTRRRV